MSFWELFLIALGLSMDAFAVSVCKGLAVKKHDFKNAVAVGLWFGTFQALMPIAGYFTVLRFRNIFLSASHWIAFLLLCAIGGNMVKEALRGDCGGGSKNSSLDIRSMFAASVATSIDALAAGAGFAFLDVDILPAALLIGAVTFAVSAAGMETGSVFGARYKNKAEFAGGVILILLGAKILIEHIAI